MLPLGRLRLGGTCAAIAIALCGCDGDDPPSVVAFTGDPRGAPQTVMYLDAPASQEIVDDEFTITVNVLRAENLLGFRFVLFTGSKDLRVMDVRGGGFLASSGLDVECGSPTIEEMETLFSCTTNAQTPEQGASGSGELAIITLAAERSGTFQLEFLRAETTAPAGFSIGTISQAGAVIRVE